MRNLVAGAMLVFASTSSLVAGPLEDGVAALNRKDYATATQLLRPLADQGSAAAQYQIALMHYHGAGVPQDHSEARQWMHRSADQDYAFAQYSLGVLYANGHGVARDQIEAAKWYRKAAEQGHAASQSALGAMYSHGVGVPQDLAAALDWLRKAAAQGDAAGQSNLGVLYAEGKVVPRDDREAAKWYFKAAMQGAAVAQSNLAHLFMRGLGVPQDFVEAYRWWSVAASRYPSAESEMRSVALGNRNRVATHMTPAQIAEAERLVQTWNMLTSADQGFAKQGAQAHALRRQDFKDLLRRDFRLLDPFASVVPQPFDARSVTVVASCAVDYVANQVFGPNTDELDHSLLQERFMHLAAAIRDIPNQKELLRKCVVDAGVLAAPVSILSPLATPPGRSTNGAHTNAQARLDNLLALSEATARSQASDAPEANDLLARGMRHAETVDTYCSASVVKDFLAPRLKSRGYVFLTWRLDFAKPDRYHVTQQASTERGELMDEWVAIDDKNYQNAGLWALTEGHSNTEMNRSLSLKGVVTRLNRLNAPSGRQLLSYDQRNERYLRVTYADLARRNDLADLKICGALVDGACDFHVWLDANTGAIIKTQSRLRGTTADAKPIDSETDRVFACQGEAIKVDPPPWLNAETGQDGTTRIVDTRVPAVPHH